MVYIRKQINGRLVDVPYESICIPKENISMIAKTTDNRTAIFVGDVTVILDQNFEAAVEDWRERALIDIVE